jgi:peroxiredoxin
LQPIVAPIELMRKMAAQKQPPSIGKKFWTAPRVALTVVTVSLIAVLGVSSCTSGDQKSEAPAGNSSGPANTSQPANTNRGVASNSATPIRSTPSPPAAAGSLPANVREASLRTVNGQTIKLSDYAGKVVLVNLWATWCGPCRAETPELVKLHKEFQARGVEMVGLSTENPDASAELVRDFVREYQVSYRIGWATRDVEIGLMTLNQSSNIPQSFIISREGRVLNTFVGFNPVYTPPKIRQALEDALRG